MEQKICRETIRIGGMFCPHCESVVAKALTALDGVVSASASYRDGSARVAYDPERVSLSDMIAAIAGAGYEVEAKQNNIQVISVIAILLSVYLIARQQGWTSVFNLFPEIETSMELGMLFMVGLMTGIHCIAMCGGINLTQAAATSRREGHPAKAAIAYNTGRVVSYTLTGLICGAIGQTVGFNGRLRGILPIMVGTFLLLMAMNMLGFFRKIPRAHLHLPKFFYRWSAGAVRNRSSFAIGLLNGLMPCGPLQSMQIYALGTGSAVAGGLSMLVFALGTVPLMFGFGFFAGKLNQKYRKYMLTVTAMLILVMGIHMIGDGLAVSGASFAVGGASEVQVAMVADGYQNVQTTIDYGGYPAIRVEAGVPVEWDIYVPEGKLNGCNGQVLVPEYHLDITLKEGHNEVRFVPERTGKFGYSCWMGMIRSTIEVV